MIAQNSTNAMEEISLAAAADLFPRKSNGKKVHTNTIRRWIEKGCRGVLLAGRKAGNHWYTTRQAIEDFRNAGTNRSIRAEQVIEVATPAQQDRAYRETCDRLRAKGFTFDEQENAAHSAVPAVSQAPAENAGAVQHVLRGTPAGNRSGRDNRRRSGRNGTASQASLGSTKATRTKG